jgi:NTP pyrophosphatase (non-canonical NTP hydrolase)
LDKIIDKLKQFIKDRNWEKFHTPENLVKSISIEAGELLELYQWGNDWQEIDIKRVKEELADILIYSILLSEKYNFDIEEIILSKIKKNERKYPLL